MALWDGRFGEGPARAMLEFSESLGTDMAMWQEDVRASVAHVVMLGEDNVPRTSSARLAGHTLIWFAGDTTLRLEGDLTATQAARVAESISPVAIVSRPPAAVPDPDGSR